MSIATSEDVHSASSPPPVPTLVFGFDLECIQLLPDNFFRKLPVNNVLDLAAGLCGTCWLCCASLCN